MSVQDKFTTTRKELNESLIERDSEISMVLTAMLAGEHCLFVGPSGTGKSMLADAAVDWIDGKKFSYLLNRFTEPNEVLGPIDIPGLKTGDHRRITTGKLPEANVAFLDEIFKASSAILNTMLRILNERKFTNGLTEIACPLKLCIAASNEWGTEAKELGALFDRFLLRKHVAPVASEDNIKKLMFSDSIETRLSTRLSMAELTSAQVEIRDHVMVGVDATDAMDEIRRKLTREGVVIGDRRLRKSVKVVKSYAWLNGNPYVTTDDLEILAHLWWVSPESQPQVVMDAIADIARPSGLLAAQLLADAAEACKVDKSLPAEKMALEYATAVVKLKKIKKELDRLSGPRAEAAKSRLVGMIQDIHLSQIDAVDSF